MKKIGYYQFEPVLGDIEENRRRISAGLTDVSADLIVLPELAFTGYSLRDRQQALELAEYPDDSESVRLLQSLAAGSGAHIVAGFAEKARDKNDGEVSYNSSVLVGPDGLVATYRKIHLFGFEAELFDPGDRPPEVSDIGGLKVGMMICFDWFFPETARLLALGGADVIAHPANLVLDWCQRSMLVRCLENNLFAVTANRFGIEERSGKSLSFTGGSQITAPRYQKLASASPENNELKIVEIDPAAARNKNVTAVNHLLDDRRPDFYGGLT